jgi:hypothetical protein
MQIVPFCKRGRYPGRDFFDMRIANRPARQAALQADALERIE